MLQWESWWGGEERRREAAAPPGVASKGALIGTGAAGHFERDSHAAVRNAACMAAGEPGTGCGATGAVGKARRVFVSRSAGSLRAEGSRAVAVPRGDVRADSARCHLTEYARSFAAEPLNCCVRSGGTSGARRTRGDVAYCCASLLAQSGSRAALFRAGCSPTADAAAAAASGSMCTCPVAVGRRSEMAGAVLFPSSGSGGGNVAPITVQSGHEPAVVKDQVGMVGMAAPLCRGDCAVAHAFTRSRSQALERNVRA